MADENFVFFKFNPATGLKIEVLPVMSGSSSLVRVRVTGDRDYEHQPGGQGEGGEGGHGPGGHG